MLAVDAPCQLVEERGHDLAEFHGVDDIQHLLHLAEEHDLFRRVNLGPILEQTKNDFFCEGGVFLQELYHTVGKLGMIHR